MHKSKAMVAGWELGNEPDLFKEHNITVSPQQLGADFENYKAVLSANGEGSTPVFGPDVADNQEYFSSVLASSGQSVDRATYHFYYGPGSLTC